MTTAAAHARALAAQTVQSVCDGRSLDAALDQRFAALPPALAGERALIQEMTYGTLRWYFRLDPLLGEFLRKPLADRDGDLRALLLVGLYQLLHMQVAPHAAVHETVEAVAVLNKDWARGLVNAVLRRARREQADILARDARDPALAHPAWLAARLCQAWPQDWPAIAAANNARPPMTLRVNLARGACDNYAARLAQAGMAARAVPDIESALVLETPAPVEALPGFHAGEVSVQDAAAQLAAVLLDARPGERVLDACAAPGGKAAHILERTPDVRLVALDIDAGRLERVRENFARLGLRGAIVAGDAAEPGRWWDGRPFDRILLDAPCSATGVIRRHPDIRLHRTPADIERLGTAQTRLLDALWPLLAPGGKLLYVTCSILPEENGQRLAAFRARHGDACRVALTHPALVRGARADAGGWQILPGEDGMDGFYYACLEKSAVVA
jgi:16S rRNA (cytosine967-C5)-methyltransferase